MSEPEVTDDAGHAPVQPAWNPPAHPVGAMPWWTPPPPQHPRATLSLVLGLVGLTGLLFLLPFAASPLAWYFGAVARREAERDVGRWSPSSSATAGLVLGVIGTALLLAMLLLMGGTTLITAVITLSDTGYGT